MSDYIKEQLKKVSFADLSNYNETTGVYYIKKYTKAAYELNKCYIIKIPNSIINNTSSVLATNWNHGLAPKHEYLKAFVSKALGKMIYVDTLAFDFETKTDLQDMFSGWLPTEEIEQIMSL